MESLIIGATEDSPEINFDLKSNRFMISGKSRPENTGKFYTPVLEWFDKFEKQVNASGNGKSEPMDFAFKLEYFNSISAKYIADIIMLLKELSLKGNNIHIKWYYPSSDDDMLEVGKEFADMVEMNFDYVAY
ncbi:MAG: DUF1987 domain-containing protein [Bacteroidia bacterium]|jgi:hypothetical protein